MTRVTAARRRRLTAWTGDAVGATAVEFAILGPVLILLLLGIIVYGGYFMMAHALQQIANDAARAAIAGVSVAERRQLAAECLSNEVVAYPFLTPAALQLGYQEQGMTATVQLAYDASGSPFWAMKGLVPMPASPIVRGASIQLGGY